MIDKTGIFENTDSTSFAHRRHIMSENIATLGLEFESKSSVSEIEKIVQAFDEVIEKHEEVQNAFQNLGLPADVTTQIGKFAQSVLNLNSQINQYNFLKKAFATPLDDKTRENIEKLAQTLASIKPVDETTTGNIAKLIRAFNGFKLDSTQVNSFKTAVTAPNDATVSTETANAFAVILNSFKNMKNVDANLGTTISGIGAAMSNLQKVPDEVVLNYASVAESMQKLNGVANVGLAVEGIEKLAGMKPVSKEDLDNLNAYIEAMIKLQQLIANSPELQNLPRAGATPTATGGTGGQQISDETAKKVGESLKPLKSIKPENATAITQILDAFANMNRIDSATILGIKKFAEAVLKLKSFKTDTANALRLVLEQMKNLPDIDQAKAQAIKGLAESIYMFRIVKKDLSTNLEALFTAMTKIQKLDDAALDSIDKLANAIIKFKFIKNNTVSNIKSVFDQLRTAPVIQQQTYQSIGYLASAMDGFRALRKSTVENVTKLLQELAKAKPIPPEALKSIRTLRDLIAAMNLNLSKTPNRVTQTNTSLYTMRTFADSTTIALNSLRSALAVTVFARSAKDFLALGEELAYVKSIAPTLEIKKLQDGLMNLSAVFGNTAKNANALYYAYSSGIRGSEEAFIKFTEMASKTALTIRSELRPTIDAMTAAMNAYGMTAEDVSEVSNNFFKIVKYGKASGEQLANSFGQVSPTAKTLGVSLDELGAAIASITKIQPTRVAITGLNNMLSKIMKPTRESASAIEKLGVDLSYSAVHTKGFVNVLKEVHDALGGNMEAIRNIFPDIRGQRAAMHLLGAGWEDFLNQVENFTNGKDEIEAAFEELTDNIEHQLLVIPNTIQKIREEMGRMVTQTLTLNGALTPLIQSFNSMSEGERKFLAGSTLLITVLASLKAAMLTYHTLQALNLRNQMFLEQFAKKRNTTQAITLMLFKKEFQRRFALLGLDKAELQSRIARIAFDKQQLTFKISLLELDKKQAIASGDLNMLKKAENALLVANNRLLRLNTLEREANNVAVAKAVMQGKDSVIKGLGTITKVTNATGAGIAAAAKQVIATITASLSKLGVLLFGALKAVAVAAAAFVAVDLVQSLIRAGNTSKMVTNEIVASVAEWVHGFKEARKSMVDFYNSLKEMRQEFRSLRASLKSAVVDFDNMKFNFFPETNKTTMNKLIDDLNVLEVQYLRFAEKRDAADKQLAEAKTIHDLYFREEKDLERLQDAYENVDKIRQQMNLVEDIKEMELEQSLYNMYSEDFMESLEQYKKQAKDNLRELGVEGFEEAYAVLKSGGRDLKELKQESTEAFEKAKAEVQKVNNEFEELNGNIASTKAQIEELGRSAISFYVSVKDAIDKEDVELMDTFQKVGYHQSRIADAYQELESSAKFISEGFITALSPDDIEKSKEALSDYMESFKFLIKNFDDVKKANKELLKDMDKNLKENELKRLKSDSKILKFYESEFATLSDKITSEVLSAETDMDTLKTLYSDLNSAANKMLDLRKKMADAEQKANQKTLELIKSFDKYSATAQSAVDVNSTEALSLMSRQWTMGMNELPAVKQDATNPYETKILEDMASIIDMVRVYSSSQMAKSDEQKAALMVGYESIRQAFSKNEDAIREQTAQIVEQLVKNNQLADRVQEERKNGKDWDTLLKDLDDIKEEIRKSGSNQFQLVNVNL